MNFLRLLIIVLITILANSVFAKPLPPGTGSSVPANILFLVDKSQSMWDPASGDKRKYVRPFIDVEPRGDGNYFTVSVDDSGLVTGILTPTIYQIVMVSLVDKQLVEVQEFLVTKMLI